MGEALLEATQTCTAPHLTLHHHQLRVFLVSGDGTHLYFYTFVICSIRALLDELQMYTNFRAISMKLKLPCETCRASL